jgi:hypothetical protein
VKAKEREYKRPYQNGRSHYLINYLEPMFLSH